MEFKVEKNERSSIVFYYGRRKQSQELGSGEQLRNGVVTSWNCDVTDLWCHGFFIIHVYVNEGK